MVWESAYPAGLLVLLGMDRHLPDSLMTLTNTVLNKILSIAFELAEYSLAHQVST